MALTRSQLIAGDASQGPVLPGQVQGVKQGDGVVIGSDGRISFSAASSTGVVKLNNANAFNGYVWPNTIGVTDTFLGVNSNGDLAWSIPAGLVNLGASPPASPKLGELWFNYADNLLYVRQDSEGPVSWKLVYQGLSPLDANTSASPAFTGGFGTEEDPFTVESVTAGSGSTVLFPSTITVTGLAPYQYVPVYDIHGDQNDYRFEATSNFADEEGTLTFKIKFTDYPQTSPNIAYTASFRLGFDTPVFIEAGITVINPVSIISPGTISGVAQVGEQLTYTTGIATGGSPPYSYSWVWKLGSNNSVLQTAGATYVLAPVTADDTVFVELTATDTSLGAAIANTGLYPPTPNVIGKGAFPNTTILFPTTTLSTASTAWDDAGTELLADGCIEFSVDGITFSQGPTNIANGGTITTRWIVSSGCANASNSATISGCVYSSDYRECTSLTIDRVPSPFLFNAVTDIIPGNVATSQAIAPVGYNSTAYVTFNPASTGTNIEASTDGGSTWSTLLAIGDTSVPINPGQTLTVRQTTGSSYDTSYIAIVNIGAGTSIQNATFSATTTNANIFNTPIGFPSTTINEVQTTWLVADGPTNLTATGCIEFKVGVGGTWTGAGDPPVAITTGDELYTRWSNTTPGVCGNAPHGTSISGTITNVPSGGTNTSVGSLTIDRVPAMFSFSDQTNQATSSVVTSNIINISGINAPTFITKGSPVSALTSLQASVGGGAWTSIPSSGETLSLNPQVSGPGVTLQIRGTTGGSTNTTYSGIVNIGQSSSVNSDTWNVSTSSAVASIVTPSIVTPVNGATGLNPNSSSPAGITITSSAYSAINGAGSHTGTDWEVYYLNGITPVYAAQVTNSPTSLTSLFVPPANILPNKTYYTRVRYRTTTPSSIVSNWSAVSQFSTATTFSLTFVSRFTPNIANSFATDSATDPAPGGRTVFVGANGYSFFTLDGVTFSAGGTTNINWLCVAFGGGKFIAAGSNNLGVHAYSVSTDNGATWNNTFYNQSYGRINSIAYSPSLDLFCFVTQNSRVLTSPSSSVSLTLRSIPSVPAITDVIWDGTYFRACAGEDVYLFSSDAVNWSTSSLPVPPFSSQNLANIAYNSSSGRYVMTRDNNKFTAGTGNSGSADTLYSNNGSTWSQGQTPIRMKAIAAGGNWFVGSGEDGNYGGEYVTSTDGQSWVLGPTLTPLASTGASVVAYIPQYDRFVIALRSWRIFSTV